MQLGLGWQNAQEFRIIEAPTTYQNTQFIKTSHMSSAEGSNPLCVKFSSGDEDFK